MTQIHLTRGYVPGVIGRVAELHGLYYHRHWRFGRFFEGKVATELAAFMDRYDDRRDGIWTAGRDRRIHGAIAIDGAHADAGGAHLRWFIVSDELRGQGIGNRLMEAAMAFCRERRYDRIYLWTFEGLHAARHLYEKHGFVLVEQQEGEGWGTTVNEQRFLHRGPQGKGAAS